MAFELPALPYASNALEPYMSARTFDLHHGKHHAAYVNNLNNLVKDTPLASQSLSEVIKGATGDVSKASIFNNAAQVWSHTFFWNCMKPGGGGAPTGKLKDKIDATFGSFDTFKEKFKEAAVGNFGCGWTWLILDKRLHKPEEEGVLKIVKTTNADLPLRHGQRALLTVDVWEHAYYLDYENRRPDFIQAFLDHLVNWNFVEEMFVQDDS